MDDSTNDNLLTLIRKQYEKFQECQKLCPTLTYSKETDGHYNNAFEIIKSVGEEIKANDEVSYKQAYIDVDLIERILIIVCLCLVAAILIGVAILFRISKHKY